MASNNPPSSPKWRNNPTKQLLYDDIVNGVLAGMKPKVAQQTRPEYQVMQASKFASRFRSLVQSVENDQLCARADDEAATKFMNRLATGPTTLPNWQTSAARQRLQLDVREQNHLNQTPQELYQSDRVYQEFSLDVFRNHLYKEVRRQKPREKPKKWVVNQFT